MFELRDWYLDNDYGYYYAHGGAYWHPKFIHGRRIHTSVVLSAVRYTDGWCITTWSGSHYILCDDTVSNDTNLRQYSLDVLEKIKIEVKDQSVKGLLRDVLTKAVAGLSIGTALLCFDSKAEYYITKALIVDMNRCVAVPEPMIHIGNFQDSVMIGAPDKDSVYDFRFFPYGGGRIQFYTWNSGELRVSLRNEGSIPLEFDTPYGSFQVPGGVDIVPAENPRYRIKEHTAPAVDKHNIWNYKMLNNGMIAYTDPKTTDDDDESNST